MIIMAVKEDQNKTGLFDEKNTKNDHFLNVFLKQRGIKTMIGK